MTGTPDSLPSIPFDERESDNMLSLAMWMRFIGYFFIAIVVINLLVGTYHLIEISKSSKGLEGFHYFFFANCVLLLIFALMGIFLIQGAKYLRLVVHTDESDQMYLGKAFLKLRNFFKLTGISILIYLIIIIIAFMFFAAFLTITS
ncbi:MAG: hypothetical protein QG635_2508 [Bacteroidota bacterium]|nr:hypothetical protein [Bacteroidota bacterium]